MGNPLLGKQPAKFLRRLNGNGTHQHGLAFCVGFLHRLHNGMELFFSGLINRVLMIFPGNRSVSGYLYYVHPVNITELSLLCERGTCHTCFFVKFIKKVLESDGCKSLALPLHLHMLFRLNGLMKPVRITPPWHNTSGKLVYNQHLIVLYHIILIPEH